MNHNTIGSLALAAVLGALLCNAFAQQPAKIPNAVEEPKPAPAAGRQHRGSVSDHGAELQSGFRLARHPHRSMLDETRESAVAGSGVAGEGEGVILHGVAATVCLLGLLWFGLVNDFENNSGMLDQELQRLLHCECHCRIVVRVCNAMNLHHCGPKHEMPRSCPISETIIVHVSSFSGSTSNASTSSPNILRGLAEQRGLCLVAFKQISIPEHNQLRAV